MHHHYGHTLLGTWLVLTVAVFIASQVLPGFRVKGLGGAVLVAALFGVLNALVGWLIFLVIGVATLGIGLLLGFLTRWVVNAIVLKLVDAMTDRLEIKGFGTALWAAAIMSVVSAVCDVLFRH